MVVLVVGEVLGEKEKRRDFFFVRFRFLVSTERKSKFNAIARSLFVSLVRALVPQQRLPNLLLLLLGQAARAGGASSGWPGSALGRLAAGRGDGAAVGGLLIWFLSKIVRTS